MNQQSQITKASPLNALAAKFSIEPAKLLDVLRGTVIKPDRNGKQATNEEVAAFCIVADQYGLSPFTREIHAFTSGEKGVIPIVGIDGWTRIVNRSGDFDGCEFEEIGDDKGHPIAITCRMHVKGRNHPVCATERFAECKRNTPPWQTMPWRMLRHKAYMQAARYAFGLAGIYDEDEARDIVATGTVTVERPPIAMPRALTDSAPDPEPEPEKPKRTRKAEAPPAEETAWTKLDAIIKDGGFTRASFVERLQEMGIVGECPKFTDIPENWATQFGKDWPGFLAMEETYLDRIKAEEEGAQ